MRVFAVGFALMQLATSGCTDERSPSDAGSALDSGGIDGGTGQDSGPIAIDGGEIVGIPCESAVCAAGTEKCCFHFTGYTCHPIDDVCEGFPAACDGPEDCPVAQVCCAVRMPSAHTACVDVCEPDEEVCHTTRDCSAGMICCPSAIALGVEGYCRPSCA